MQHNWLCSVLYIRREIAVPTSKHPSLAPVLHLDLYLFQLSAEQFMLGRWCGFAPALAHTVLGLSSQAVCAEKFSVQIKLGWLGTRGHAAFLPKKQKAATE